LRNVLRVVLVKVSQCISTCMLENIFVITILNIFPFQSVYLFLWMVRGCGAILLNKPKKLVEIVGAMTKALNSRQVTVKIRTGWDGESSFLYFILPCLACT
jgi:hypothetical protein